MLDLREYLMLTLPGTVTTDDRAVYVRRDAVEMVRELDPLAGAPNSVVRLASGVELAVRETSTDLFGA